MSFRQWPYSMIAGSQSLSNQQNGQPTTNTYKFLLALFNRSGGGTGIVPQVDNSVTAAGSGQGDATVLTADWNNVSAGAGGVVMPTMQPGNDITVLNTTGGSINVYPFSGAAINGGAANSPVTLSPGELGYFQCWTNTQLFLVYTQTGL